MPYRADTGRGRAVRWVLLTGNRRVVVGWLLVGVFLTLVPIGVLAPSEVNQLLDEQGAVASILNTLLSGVILLVSIVVSVTSLSVSRELASIDGFRDHISGSREFRQQTENVLEVDVSPAEPANFLEALSRAIREHADEIRAAVENSDEAVAEEVNALIDGLVGEVEPIEETLAETEFRTIDMLLTALAFDYAEQQQAVRQFQSRHDGEFPDGIDEEMDDLLDALEYFSTARQYFKSLYFEREFANFSRDLIYTSIPAILLISYAILVVDGKLVSGTTLGIPNIYAFTGAAYTVALAPFAVLTAYVLRVSAVTKRSLASGPFVLKSE
ncbi:hypothetical protein [Natronomonas gomsonensis]|uniref:hypothetical protein n=1 Tax=Natronomonas gomsonensis TaxID=1046043 RepID=UPI0015BE26F2|nr:hypothetical protein [Natronomonas gomsonensis]